MTHSKYIPVLLEKINKKTTDSEYLYLILSDNANIIKDRMMEILKEYGLGESDYNKIFTCSAHNPKISPSDKKIDQQISDSCDMEKMYKTLLYKSHPDRHIGKEQNNDFVDITAAYEKCDIIKLLDFASKYDCDIDDKNILVMLEKQYSSIKKYVKILRSNSSYQLFINDDEKPIREIICLYQENIKLELENAELRERAKKLGL